MISCFALLQSFAPATTATGSKHAAILLKGVEGKLPSGLSRVSGVATRSARPLLEQDKPWEPRLDNGCEWPSLTCALRPKLKRAAAARGGP